MSDERRAEIEAVARFYYRWMMGDDYPEFPWDDDNTPSNETKDEAERFAAEFALDRVRDARGDERRAEIEGPHEGCLERACECVQDEIASLRRLNQVLAPRYPIVNVPIDVLDAISKRAEDAEAALDRVRDARGDEERTPIAERGGPGWKIKADAGGNPKIWNAPPMYPNEEVDLIVKPQSSQGEDHETVRAILNRIIDAASQAGADGVLPAETVRVECLRATYALGAARAPQGEDHENG